MYYLRYKVQAYMSVFGIGIVLMLFRIRIPDAAPDPYSTLSRSF